MGAGREWRAQGGVNCNHLSRGDGALEVENSRVNLGKSEGPHPVRA